MENTVRGWRISPPWQRHAKVSKAIEDYENGGLMLKRESPTTFTWRMAVRYSL
jgi:hypothetical protein